MTITFRRVKGSNLTADEVDDNFEELDNRVTAIEDDPPVATGISNITVVGTQMTIHLADSTVLGPYTLPQANFRPSVVSEIAENTDGVYVPVLGDANGYKRYAGAADLVVQLPTAAAVAFPVDAEIIFHQAGDGTITFDTVTAGPTLNGITGFLNRSRGRGATVKLKKVATDEWDIADGLLAEDVT